MYIGPDQGRGRWSRGANEIFFLCLKFVCLKLTIYIEISWFSKYIEDVAQRTSDNSKYQIWLIRYQKCENKRGCLLRAFMLKKILREIFSILLDFFKKFFCNKKCIGYWQFLTKKNFSPVTWLLWLAWNGLFLPVKWLVFN